ncbi:T9SS type A sorting domain-containing protein [Hymenobacter chitinivorans]|uniref:Putative secreted protein (Por secretion system target) n=1 Tax=Hymenobacter chitinivorans DSM 11115 TaxID=1121954 RepID=A0A2M9B5W1_9BACT|nr:T9SS type A sorting domain-containing protein [Hymenobacter chitinivorans]PJJ53317.1 putative secreted protein (Por secretion system target) [Hymenobacter chitinivorans DSM 11115]
MKSLYYFRILSLCLVGLLPGRHTVAQTESAYYSSFATPASPANYRTSATGSGLCLGCLVANPERAADTDLENYATIQNTLGVLGGGVALALQLSGTAPATYRAGVVISSGNVLNAGALATITLRTYLGGSQQQQLLANDALVSSTALSDSRTRLEFVAAKPFDQLEIVVGGILNGVNTVRVLYAYGVPTNTQFTTALGYLSRSPEPSAADYKVTTGGGAVAACVGTGVANPTNAVDAGLNNFATLTTVAGVGNCSASLQVKLEGPAPAGYQAGFVVGNGGVLDVNALNSVQITTYLNGVAQETRAGAELLQLTLLPDNRYQVSFKSGQPFDRVEIKQSALASALNTLQVYYGFGIEPRAFQDDTPVLSDFKTPQRGTEYQESASGLLCLGCSSTNPQKAADNTFTESDYAEVRFPVAALGTYKLKLRLNGAGKAGNRAGIALRTNDALLNTTLLQNIRINTYGGTNGSRLLESSSASTLLDLGLVGDNRHELGFLTTQDFEWVEVEITGGVGLFSAAQIYYAFADDPNPAFPAEVGPPANPLPVELRVFQGRSVETAVELTWQTASEQKNAYFLVERSLGVESGFTTIGQVRGAGTTTRGASYQFRDETAARQDRGPLYYRLRQVDQDGTEHFSPVVVITWKSEQTTALQVYPNPAAETQRINVQLVGLPTDGASLQVYGNLGELIWRGPATGSALEIPLHTLRQGLYHLVLTDAAGQRQASQRLVVTGR